MLGGSDLRFYHEHPPVSPKATILANWDALQQGVFIFLRELLAQIPMVFLVGFLLLFMKGHIMHPSPSPYHIFTLSTQQGALTLVQF